MSSEINIEELERLAKAATPGPWKACGTVEQIGGDCKDIIPTSVSCTAYCYGGSADRAEDKDLIFIAAANPFAVLSLIDRVKKAESDRDALAARLEMDPDHGIPDGIDCRNATIEMQDAQISALAAKLAELEGQEPVAVVCDTYELRWIGRGPIAQIISKHQIKAGAPLYARPVPAEEGIVTVTTNDAGRCVMVSRQDEDHRILSVIWEAKDVPTEPVNARLLSALIQCRDRFVFYVGHHLDKGDMGKAAENEKFVAIANDAISAAESAPKAGRLTDEEVDICFDGSDGTRIGAARAIETAVLRKNGLALED